MNTPATDAPPPGWRPTCHEGADALEKRWRFADFRQTMVFVNAVAELAERLDHHPELQLGYGHCRVLWTTHDAGGVTARDREAARQLDALAATLPGAVDPS
ncbi:MAG: 4a-hydroxytetrahydrobiopterin dehydratase [Burkholderiales bacterium]|nr:4a-hydroxytetrahydrobiopterin dehydratase [Burkholderiales bacterium]MBK8665439.1 4a-hydroxytetrahydrobiopterin dehydratase [Burkholderiales bacterium]